MKGNHGKSTDYIDKEKIIRDRTGGMSVLFLSRKYQFPESVIEKILAQAEKQERDSQEAKGLVSLARVEAAFTKYLDQRHAPVNQRIVDNFMSTL